MKIVLIGNYAESLISFRGALLSELVKLGHEVIACAPGENEDVAKRLKALGVTYKALKLDRTSINPIKDLVFFCELGIFFHKILPEIVITYTIKPVIYGSIAAKLMGVANIFSIITGLGYVFIGNSLKQRIIRNLVYRLYRKALPLNKVIFFLNKDDWSLFKNLGLVKNNNRTQLLYGEGIDVSVYSNMAVYGSGLTSYKLETEQRVVVIDGTGVDLSVFENTTFKHNKVSFLLIARLIKDKGIYEYIRAATILKKRYPWVEFRLLGPFDTNPTAISETQIKAWHNSGVIEYLGETKDVRPFLADTSVYVLPSYREGTPRTVLEAMAMGRPIITTDAPGCRETVIEGENGFLVPIKDEQALAKVMERFIQEPELIGKMGKRSREIAEEKFDVNKINATILQAMGLKPVLAKPDEKEGSCLIG